MNKLFGILLLILPIGAFAIDKDIKPDSCDSVELCILRISEVLDTTSTPGRYPSNAEQAVIKRLLEFGDEAIPAIVSLLEDNNELIARIGAIALRNSDSIEKKYLPNIIAGLDKEVSWLAPALAKVNSPAAAREAIKRYLVSEGAPQNQEAFAVRNLGERAIPFIIEEALCKVECSNRTYYLLGRALEEMGSEKSIAAKQLILLAYDPSIESKVSFGALYMISFLGEPGLVVEEKLIALRKLRPFLDEAIDNALVGIGSEHAAPVFAERLRARPDRLTLRDIAELGTKARLAGVAVTELLTHRNEDIRIGAARTLGFIQYRPSAPSLIELLTEPSNIQLNWVAAESLGRMRSETAIAPLTQVSETHWYPPVKDAALKALENIKTGNSYPEITNKWNFPRIYFSYDRMKVDTCKSITLKTKNESIETKFYKSNAKDKLEKLAYSTVILSYGAGDEEQQLAEDPDGIVEVNAGNMVEHRQDIKQIPDLALRTKDGWLAGSSRGEWGGELVFIPDNGKAIKIIDDNVEDIYKLGNRFIAVTGLVHLSMNYGKIFEIARDKDGAWYEKPWLTLPGSPRSSWLVETGELLINTYDGGSILLSADGSMRLATCASSDKS